MASTSVDIFIKHPGALPRSIVDHSHFNDPIENALGRISGRSRRWGDADVHTQRIVVCELTGQARDFGYSKEESAFLLAVARVESGFNPDAASSLSSASGIGQFIDKTGASYGLWEENRFDLRANTSALVRHLKKQLDNARKRFEPKNAREAFAIAYALHHDGPSLRYGGYEIAKRHVIPTYERISGWLRNEGLPFLKGSCLRG